MLTIARFFLGLTFLIFGIAKLLPIEAFEFLLVDQRIIGWDGTPFLARFIVFWEILLGLGLLFNFEIKKVSSLTIATLLLFTTYLIYDFFTFGNREDCGCTGQLFALSTTASIGKNLVLLLLALALFTKGKFFNWKRRWLLLLLLIGISAGITLYFAPFYESYKLSEKVNEEIDLTMLPVVENTGLPLNYQNDEVIVCFVSPKCPHCKKAIQRLKIISDQYELPAVYLVFYGRKPKVEAFMEEYTFEFPYIVFPDDEFMRIIKGEMPTMYHIDQGILKQVWKGDRFEADELIDLAAPQQ